jgi:hypothetical protein
MTFGEAGLTLQVRMSDDTDRSERVIVERRRV